MAHDSHHAGIQQSPLWDHLVSLSESAQSVNPHDFFHCGPCRNVDRATLDQLIALFDLGPLPARHDPLEVLEQVAKVLAERDDEADGSEERSSQKRTGTDAKTTTSG